MHINIQLYDAVAFVIKANNNKTHFFSLAKASLKTFSLSFFSHLSIAKNGDEQQQQKKSLHF
jgi:hypothetical protein